MNIIKSYKDCNIICEIVKKRFSLKLKKIEYYYRNGEYAFKEQGYKESIVTKNVLVHLLYDNRKNINKNGKIIGL